MDLRPQAHDIIRTWLFSTVLRAHLEHDSLPWLHAAISGFVTDPDRKKMSKSKGNVVTPFALLEEHGSDGVRYWAAKGGPGVDTMFDAGQMKVGRRLAIKVLNASKFILAPSMKARASPARPGDGTARAGHRRRRSRDAAQPWRPRPGGDAGARRVTNTAARSIWSSASSGASATTISSSSKDGATATRDLRRPASANSALIAALSVYLRLFAPYLPFATEEVWSWWKEGSVHRAAWPTEAELAPLMRGVSDDDQQKWSYAREVLGEVRKRRSEAKQPLKVPIVRAVIADTDARLAHLDAVEADLRAAVRIEAIERKPAGGLSVEVEFGAAPPA